MFEIGTTLREARLRRGLDMPECERQTKIRGKYLRAMEDEEFDVLPAPTYVRGFLRAYAEFLGLDGRLVVDEYESRFLARETGLEGDTPRKRRPGPAGPFRTPAPKSYRRQREPEGKLLWVAAASMLMIALIAYGFTANDHVGRPSTIPNATTDEGTHAPSVPARSGVPRSAAPLVIVMTGQSPEGSYLQVRGKNAAGKLVYDGTLPAGSTHSWTVANGLWVRVGRSDGISVTVNGVAKPLDAGAQTGNYQITRAGVERLAAGG